MPKLHQSSEPPHECKRLVMIMGVQRSGTTALFKALATAPGVTAREESEDDDLYLDWFLRPEPEIRGVLGSLPGTVLLKPVRESEVRSPRSVLEEYADYDLRIVWLYRDPVNVFDSYVRRGWRTADETIAMYFANEWERRNVAAIADASHVGDRLVVVRYEDLVGDPRVLPRLAERLGMVVNAGFRADSALGRKRLPPVLCLTFDAFTAEVRGRLDQLRTVRPANPQGSVVSGTPRWMDRLQSAARQLVSREKNCSAVPLHHDAETNTFISSGYDASRAILDCSRPCWPTPTLDLARGNGIARTDLGHFLAARRRGVVERIGAAAHVWLTNLPIQRECDLFERLYPLAIASMAAWLDVPESLAEAIRAEAQSLYVTAESSAPSPGWSRARDALMQRGLIADLCAAGLIERDDVLGFVCDTVMRLLAVPALVGNALIAVASRPEMITLARERPAVIPGIFAETMRLVPMWFSMRRRMGEALRVADVIIPENATVDVFVVTANRDPAAFEAPDELRPERRGPEPLLSDTDTAGFTGLTDAPPWGYGHALFDVSALVFERLLAGPLIVRFPSPPRTMIQAMPGGSSVQMPSGLLVALDSRTA